MRKRYKMHYWLNIPDKWYYKRKWYDHPVGGSSNARDYKTAKKAFRALDNSPTGSTLLRFIKHVPGKGWLTEEWEKI